MIIWGHRSKFFSKYPCIWQEQDKFAITPQSHRKYCYFGVFKIFLSKILNGDPQLSFHYLSAISKNYVEKFWRKRFSKGYNKFAMFKLSLTII